MKHEHETAQPAPVGQVERGVGRPADEARKRVRAVEADQRGGWIARNVHTGAIYPSEDFRWHTRAGARCAAWEARMLHALDRQIEQ